MDVIRGHEWSLSSQRPPPKEYKSGRWTENDILILIIY